MNKGLTRKEVQELGFSIIENENKFGYNVYRYGRLCNIRINPITGYAEIITSTQIALHRLVYVLKIGDIPEGMQVDHKNDNRLDNRKENLQLLTHYENVHKKVAKRSKEFQDSGLFKEFL